MRSTNTFSSTAIVTSRSPLYREWPSGQLRSLAFQKHSASQDGALAIWPPTRNGSPPSAISTTSRMSVVPLRCNTEQPKVFANSKTPPSTQSSPRNTSSSVTNSAPPLRTLASPHPFPAEPTTSSPTPPASQAQPPARRHERYSPPPELQPSRARHSSPTAEAKIFFASALGKSLRIWIRPALLCVLYR